MGYITEYTNYTINNIKYRAGVYSITCKVNGKYYIGGTEDLYDRLRLHIGDLLKGKHHNSYLQRAVNKYGIENFEFEVIEFYDKNIVFGMESWWINVLDACNKKVGYNLNPNTKTRQGASLSQKTRDKISKKLKGKKRDKEVRERATKELRNTIGKAVIQLDLEGNFIKEWEILSDAARELNIIPTNITSNAKGRLSRCKDWIFVYKEDYNPNKDYRPFESIKVSMLSLDNQWLRDFKDVFEAAEFVNGNVSCIRAVYNNYISKTGQKHLSYKGYKWKKID